MVIIVRFETYFVLNRNQYILYKCIDVQMSDERSFFLNYMHVSVYIYISIIYIYVVIIASYI